MPKFIIRRVETLEVEADDRYEAGKLAMLFSNSTKVEEISVDYYYDAPCEVDIEDIYDLVI